MRSYDVQAIKAAAAGRGAEILSALAGLPREILDGRHHPCPKCGGVDRFRFDTVKEFCVCNACFNKTNGDVISADQWATGRKFRESLEAIASYLGLSPAEAPSVDPLATVAREKSVRPESLAAYGAAVEKNAVVVPQWGPDGAQCSTFTMRPGGDKGRNAKGKKAGLFLPVVDGKPRLPADGETWHVVEGCKDAAALHGLGMFAVGLPTCSMNNKFSPLLRGVHVIFIPDLDTAGLEGANKSAAKIFRSAASVRVASLPGEFKASHGDDVRDVLKRPDGEALIRDAIANAQPWQPTGDADLDGLHLPEVKVGPDEMRMTDETIEALSARADIFQRGGVLVEVRESPEPPPCIVRPEGGVRAVQISRPRIREIISASACFTKLRKTDDGEEWCRVPVPSTVVDQTEARGYWPRMRSLEGLVTSPQFLMDGSILAARGYDPRSGLFLATDQDFSGIHESPTLADAKGAAAELLDIVADFPFDDVSRAGWLATVLTAAARHAIDGPCPLVAIDANTRGSGKSLAADCIGIIQSGRQLPRTPASGDDDEFRKRITSILLAGEPMVLLDNVSGVLGCAALDALLTSTTWTDRVLGGSRMTATLPAKAVWIATGNNLQFQADTARRTIRLRLTSLEENPEERTGFRHPNLLAWVRQARARLAVAAVTILRAWHVAGRPSVKMAPWGSFDSWSDLIRNVTAWLEISDPGASRQAVQKESDRSAMLLRQLLGAWEESDPEGHGITVAEALSRAEKGDVALAAAFAELTGPSGKLSPKSVGMKMHHLRGRVFDGRCFDRIDGRMGVVWKVRQVDFGGTNGTSGTKTNHYAGDFEESSNTYARTHTHVLGGTVGFTTATTASTSPCDHNDPATWVHRDGKAFCPGCDKFMGRLPANVAPSEFSARGSDRT